MSDPRLEQTAILMNAVQRGDTQATDELFRRYLPRVRRIVAARLGKSLGELLELDDIVQETLLDAFSSLTQWEGWSLGGFYNWLARAVENNIADQWRRASAQKRGGRKVRVFADLGDTTLGSPGFAAGGGTPSEVLGSQELDGRLEHSLLNLRDEYREVVVLRVLCEMSFDEIAQEMKVDGTGKVRTWFSRALGQMRDTLGDVPDLSSTAD